MVNKKLSCSVTIEGALFNCPAKLSVGSQNGSAVFGGIVEWGEKSISDTLEVMDNKLPNEIKDHVDSLLPACKPGKLSVAYQKDMFVILAEESGVDFKLVQISGETAVLFVFNVYEERQGGNKSSLINVLNKAADFFGIKEFLFYAQSGNSFMLPILRTDNKAFSSVPVAIKECSFLTYAHIVMDGDSVFEKGVRTLFGLKETELYLGAGNGAFTTMITIPSFDTDFLKSRDMYMLMESGNTPRFVIKGSFIFKFLKDITFTVDCGVSANAFRIEAYTQVKKPVPLFGPFSIGDSCLMIEAGAALSFGLYSSLYIRKIQLFGAVILKANGPLVVPELLSAAVSDLSIPILVDNLLGQHVDGIEALDFIKILGLPFQNMQPFSKEQVKNKDVNAIVNKFNSQIKSDALKLAADSVQLTSYGSGMDLADLKRIRHYYIDENGQIKLNAQFYYSTVDTRIGNYTVQRGFFICGVIEIFNKSFEVLFSYRENEGVLAYAKIPSMDLGFLKIGPSKFNNKQEDSLPIAKDSVLAQFLNPVQQGVVFFLSADKKEVSFYFDGSINVLYLFQADARIIFCKGLISVDLRVIMLSILQISLHLSVNYSDFSSANFSFVLMIDTAPLTEKLVAVTRKIDDAIGKLRNKINNAKREVDRAQAHVNELYGQISSFDRKIEDCKNAIRNAKWWKKAFVAIAKGIEIGAYEVAKAGIYVAIGVATAALNVAKGVLSLTGKIGENVLNAVNAVVKGAMSVFYINYVQLEASANLNQQYFLAKMEFVALGKKYKLEKQIGKKALTDSPENALSGAINEKIGPDLDHIEDGAFKSSWRKYRHEEYTVEQHCKRLDSARENLQSSIYLMKSMQNTYINEFNMPMEEFDEMNVSLIDSLGYVENALNTGIKAGNVAELGNAMGGLKRSVASQERKGVFRDEELVKTKKLIADYDEARMFYDKALGGLKDVKSYKKMMEEHCDAVRDKTEQNGNKVVNYTDGDIGAVLSKVEEQMYEAFPVGRSGKDFINISRESVIRDSFANAYDKLNIKPDEKLDAVRSRSRKGSYQNRL